MPNIDNLKPFKKGQSGNPAGRPPTPIDLKESRKLNRSEFERAVNKYLFLPRNELEAIQKCSKSNMFDLIVIKLIMKTAETGDYQRLNFIFDRIIGKVKDEVIENQKTETIEEFLMRTSPNENF